MVKPGKFGHLHLVYYFTVPLTIEESVINIWHYKSNLCSKSEIDEFNYVELIYDKVG